MADNAVSDQNPLADAGPVAPARRAADGLPALVGVLTPDGVLLEAGGAAFAGLTPEDVLGRPFDRAPWWSWSSETRARLREALAGARRGEGRRCRVRAQVAAGRFVDLDLSLVPLRDETGRGVAHLALSATAAGEQRRAEDEVARLNAELEQRVEERRRAEEHEARLAAILEATPDLVSTATPDGRVLYLNGAARRALGLPEHGDPPEWWPIARGHPDWAAALIRDEAVPTAVRDGFWSGETAVLGHDGREIPVSQVIIAHRGPDGAVDYLSTIARDISERRQAERALRVRNRRLRLLSDTAAELIAANGSEGLVLRLFDRIAEQLDLDACFSFLVNDEGDALRLDCCVGVPEEEARSLTRLEFGEAICGTVAQTRRPMHVSNIQGSADPKVQLVKGYGIRAYACSPLMAGGRLLGTLSFATRRRDRFSEEDITFFRTVSHYVALAYGRLRTERAAHDAAEQRWLALRAANLGTWDYNLVAGTISWDERCRAIFGLTADRPASFEEATGLIHPDDRDAAVRAFGDAVAPGSSGGYEMEKRIVRPDGSVRWVVARGQVYFDGGEGAERRPVRMIGAVMDVTERKRAEEQRERLLEQLAAERARLEAVLQYLPAGVLIAEAPSGRMVLGNAQVARIWRQPYVPAESIEEYRAYRGFHADGSPLRPDEWPLARTIITGEVIVDEEIEFLRGDGTRGTMSVSSAPIRGSGGQVVAAVAVFDDITGRKRAEARQSLLLAELDHRVKNMLATIQSLIVQTRTSSDGSLEEFSEALEGRIRAMAHAHSLLTRSRWEGASLRAIVAEELRPFCGAEGEDTGGGNAAIDGPELALGPKAALALSMVVHELTTNAAKYGALSVPGGRVDVAWEVTEGGGTTPAGRVLALRWTEHGGPRVEPPRRRGFGRTVIERSLAYEVHGEVRLDFPPEGVACAIAIPLDQLVERDSDQRPERAAAAAAAAPAEPRRAGRRSGAADRCVLVVEDSMLVAMEIEAAVRANGWRVVGPAGSLADALELARGAEGLDGAVLDINLDGAEVYPVADTLLARGVPVVFATGYDAASILPARYRGVPTLRKPFGAAELRRALQHAFA